MTLCSMFQMVKEGTIALHVNRNYVVKKKKQYVGAKVEFFMLELPGCLNQY